MTLLISLPVILWLIASISINTSLTRRVYYSNDRPITVIQSPCIDLRDNGTWPKQVRLAIEECRANVSCNHRPWKNRRGGSIRPSYSVLKIEKLISNKLNLRKREKETLVSCVLKKQNIFSPDTRKINWDNVDSLIDGLSIGKQRKEALEEALDDCRTCHKKPMKIFRCFFRHRKYRRACPIVTHWNHRKSSSCKPRTRKPKRPRKTTVPSRSTNPLTPTNVPRTSPTTLTSNTNNPLTSTTVPRTSPTTLTSRSTTQRVHNTNSRPTTDETSNTTPDIGHTYKATTAENIVTNTNGRTSTESYTADDSHSPTEQSFTGNIGSQKTTVDNRSSYKPATTATGNTDTSHPFSQTQKPTTDGITRPDGTFTSSYSSSHEPTTDAIPNSDTFTSLPPKISQSTSKATAKTTTVTVDMISTTVNEATKAASSLTLPTIPESPPPVITEKSTSETYPGDGSNTSQSDSDSEENVISDFLRNNSSDLTPLQRNFGLLTSTDGN